MRTRLAAYYQQTHWFTAIFQKFSKTADGSNVACLYGIRLHGSEVADHVWVHRSGQMKKLELQRGDVVCFEARVGRYARGEPFQHVSEIQYDFTLEKVRAMRILKRSMNGGSDDRVEYFPD